MTTAETELRALQASRVLMDPLDLLGLQEQQARKGPKETLDLVDQLESQDLDLMASTESLEQTGCRVRWAKLEHQE